MINLNFNQLFHFDHINSEGKIINNTKKITDPNTTGIYIWGFVYYFEKKTNKIGDFVDFSRVPKEFDPENMLFIPYYVGKSECGKNGNGSIFKRINQHHNITKGDATKYIRFTVNYMKSFFNDKMFPIKIKNKPNNNEVLRLIQSNSNSIQYFNDQNCLKAIYKVITIKLSGRKNSDCRITDQKIGTNKLPDTLAELIQQKNNFWFCYATVSDNFSYEKLEAHTFWTLKGKTISQTINCPNPNPNIVINDNCGLKIFKKTICNQFPGY